MIPASWSQALPAQKNPVILASSTRKVIPVNHLPEPAQSLIRNPPEKALLTEIRESQLAPELHQAGPATTESQLAPEFQCHQDCLSMTENQLALELLHQDGPTMVESQLAPEFQCH